MALRAGNRLGPSAAFARAAYIYWFDVFPQVCREIDHWHKKADAIPDTALRQVALEVQISKRGNLEGAAAFAVFSPAANRPAVIRAQVAFQAVYDYVDNLAEQQSSDPIHNGRQLHQALLVSLDPTARHLDYYAYHPERADAGYLAELIDACKAALSTLPSYISVAASARRLTERIVSYQSFNLTKTQGDHTLLERWASSETPPHCDLEWWETAASAGSSLGIFALIAMASRPKVSPCAAFAVENAYFPWIGSLHSLLDSLIDLPQDRERGDQSLVAHYASTEEMATRMQMIARQCLERSERLPDGSRHSLILGAMVGLYLSADEAHLPYARQATAHIVDVLGGSTKLTILVFRIRRIARLTCRLLANPEVEVGQIWQ